MPHAEFILKNVLFSELPSSLGVVPSLLPEFRAISDLHNSAYFHSIMFQCPQCEKTYQRKAHLLRHQQTRKI